MTTSPVVRLPARTHLAPYHITIVRPTAAKKSTTGAMRAWYRTLSMKA